MKTTLLKAVVCVTLVLIGSLNVDLKAQDKFFTNDVVTDGVVTSKMIYRHNGSLYNHMKYDFSYDEQGRVTEKEAFKWNSAKSEWMPYYKINLSYADDQVVMDYAKWNERKKVYDEAQEKNIYELDGMNTPVALHSYKWDSRNDDWKMIDTINLGYAPVLFAETK